MNKFPNKKIFFRSIYYLIVLAVFIFLVRFLWLNWQKVKDYHWTMDYRFLAISLVFFFIYTGIAALVWRKIIMILEPEKTISRFSAIRVYMYSLFGKYLPGISWAPVARLYFGKHEFDGRKLAISVIYENFIIIISGFLVSLFLLGIFLKNSLSGFYLVAIASIIGGFILIHPKIFYSMVNFILAVFKREVITRNEFLKVKDIVKIIFYYFSAYVFAGVGFYFLIRSVFYLSAFDIPVMIGAYALALVSGIVVVFAPSGLGVREAVLVAILSFYFSLESAVFIAIIARIWSTIGEIISFVAVWFVSNLKTSPAENSLLQLEYYRRAAADFDSARMNRCHIRKIKFISGFMNIRPGETILEVGIGTGIHAKWLLEMNTGKNINFLGCDLSPEMLKEASNKIGSFPGVKLFNCQAENLPLASQSVNKAYMSGSLHHFSDRRKSIEELVRVVAPGGIIVVSEPNIFNPLNFIFVLINIKTETGQFHTYPGGLRRIFRDLPVEIIKQKLFNATPPFPLWASGIFDKIDKLFEALPIARNLCSMNLIVVKRI